MLKRYSIIALLLFAYTIVLAHSIIPHHHHDDHKLEQTSGHQHGLSYYHSEAGEEGLAHQFGNYIHSVNTADVYQQPDAGIDQSWVVISYVIPTFIFKVRISENLISVFGFSNDYTPLIQQFLSPKGLRAPPSCLV